MSREISIRARADHPALLTGLDRWLQLGLISDRDVREIASTHLSWPVPPPLPQPPPATTAKTATRKQEFAAELPTAAIAPRSVERGPSIPKAPLLPAIPEVWQTLRDNFSILWLLAAGVFIIVAASTGLAITQWQTLPAILQYGLLWAYSLGFAGVSLWAARRENLVLTARSLQILAGLLVPVNFWAMHSFRLWSFGPMGWLAIVAGTVTLGTWIFLARLPLPALYLGVSAIQLLWAQPFWVGLALQGGVIALAIAQEFLKRPPSFWTYYGLGLVFVRGALARTLSPASLGLALGAWGWLLGRSRERSGPTSGPLVAVGDALAGGLLLWGAIATWQNPFPWQATGAVILGVELCLRRLRRSQRSWDIFYLFATGAIGYASLWQWLPPALQTTVQTSLARWLEIPPFGLDILTLLGLLPYLFIFLGSLTVLRRRSQFPQSLLRWGDAIVLSIAGILALAFIWFPGPRSLSFACFSGLLAWVGSRWHSRGLLIFAHGTGLLALGFSIAWKFDPSIQGWLAIVLGLTLGEWLLGTWGDRQRHGNALHQTIWRQGWSFGSALAGLGYVLLVSPAILGTAWAMLWEIVPIALAILARGARIARRRQLAAISTIALGAAVLPVLEVPAYRIASLGLAALVMLLNAWHLPQVWVMATHIGYLLAYTVACLAPRLQDSQWFLAAAIALGCLFIGRQWLSRIYARACNGWAAFLAILLASGFGIHLAQYHAPAYFTLATAPAVPWQLPTSATALLAIAILWYRRRSQKVDFLATEALGIAGELALAEGMAFAGGNLELLAIGNLLVSWSALVWPLRRRVENEVLAAGFGLLALLFHLGKFSPYSGLITLGVALLGLVLGARRRQKFLSRLAIAGISLAVCELLLFQFWESNGLSVEGFLAFAAAATIIAIAYRLLAWGLPARIDLNLTRSELIAIAQGHWWFGSLAWLLTVGVATLTPAPTLPIWSVVVGFLLASWAFIVSRNPAERRWTYGGWIFFVLAIAHWRLLQPGLSVLDPWQAAIALGFGWLAGLMPWERFGWPDRRIWQTSALGLAAFGMVLHWQALAPYSGLTVLVAAALSWQIGMQWSDKTPIYVALGGLSLAIAETLLYGLQVDGSITFRELALALTAAATAIAVLYDAIAPIWPGWLCLTRSELRDAAKFHGIAGMVLLGWMLLIGVASPGGLPSWGIGLGAVLAGWAFWRGRKAAAIWIYGGALESIGTVLWVRALMPSWQVYDPWWAALASFIALALFHLPWQAWGWRDRAPWQRVAIALPCVAALLSSAAISSGSLFLVAGCYGWLAQQQRRWRWSYGSIPFLLWGFWQWFARLDWLDPTLVATLIGSTILYVAQVDPSLRQPSRRHWRHWLRCAGSFPICVTAAIAHGNPGLIPAALGLGFSFVGLALRVRAFLLVGSLTLIWTVGDRTFTLSQQYAFAQWLIGIALGTALVGIGATFEGQRGQRLTALLQAWWQDLERWD